MVYEQGIRRARPEGEGYYLAGVYPPSGKIFLANWSENFWTTC